MPTCKIEFHNYSFIIFSDHIVLVFKLYQTILNHNITAGVVGETLETCRSVLHLSANRKKDILRQGSGHRKPEVQVRFRPSVTQVVPVWYWLLNNGKHYITINGQVIV